MLAELVFLGIEFAVQTAILFVLLWVIIKIQKLDQRFEFSFLGVLGAAALANGLNLALRIILGHFIGDILVAYISGPIVFVVLLYRVKKTTGADYVDALFTVAISRALLFVANLFLLAALMGDLRAHVENTGELETDGSRPEVSAEAPVIMPTNTPALKTNPPVAGAPANPLKPVEPAAPEPSPPAQNPPTNPAAPPVPAKPAENLAKYFSVKGVTRNGANSAVTVQTGARTYTVFLEEAALMQTAAGPISVRFAELGDDSVTLEINGEPARFRIP
jgi:hypothetical protein